MFRFPAYIILFLFVAHLSNAQVLSKTDSVLIKQYWNKIVPKSVDSKSDLLYSGIDNNLIINYPDNESKKYEIIVRTHNGKILKTEDGWLTIPRNAGRSFMIIFLISSDNDTLMIGKKEFTVKNIPYPILKIKDQLIMDSVVLSKKLFFRGDSLQLFFTDDLPQSNYWYGIKSFTLGYSYGGIYISSDNNGAYFSPRSLELISGLVPGQELVIKVTSVSPSQVLRYMPIIRFKVF